MSDNEELEEHRTQEIVPDIVPDVQEKIPDEILNHIWSIYRDNNIHIYDRNDEDDEDDGRKKLKKGLKYIEYRKVYGPGSYDRETKTYNTCSICTDYLYRCSTVILSCGHIFHEDCIEDLLNSSSSSRYKCPLCRRGPEVYEATEENRNFFGA